MNPAPLTGLGNYGPDGLPKSGVGHYGPDGQTLSQGAAIGPDGLPLLGSHKGVEVGFGATGTWFRAESNRMEQERLAQEHLMAICATCDQRQMQGLCPDGRWTNDTEVFPDLRLVGTPTSAGVIPFPPHDQQYYICGLHDTSTSTLRQSAIPSLAPDEDGNSTWLRLVDCADCRESVRLFDDTEGLRNDMGKVFKGGLENGYFVEALQAISLRPKLARQLFYCWDVRRSVYVARLHKHGTWMRVEVDDYVPMGTPGSKDTDGNLPICCRSEFYPHVLWPSLVEKAYAKLHTARGATSETTNEDRGGWEALGGGGRVEDALSDLTGGVAGRFQTGDVSPDRLFIYIYELQRDTLFVCRPSHLHCDQHGVLLNPYYPYAVNRAVFWEGKCYIQLFCGAPGIFDGGLQDLGVPYSLVHAEDFPETTAQGFFWTRAEDFAEYMDTIFECRLVSSGDVAIPNMPPPRLPGVVPGMPGMLPGGMPGAMMMPGTGFPGGMGVPMGPGGCIPQDGLAMPWFEHIYATEGQVSRHNPPEFNISVPEYDVPCEIVCVVEQVDPRMTMKTPVRDKVAATLVKVYESANGGFGGAFSADLVCKSSWMATRDAMVVFSVTRGGQFKAVAEFSQESPAVERMIFRGYCSKPGVQIRAGVSTGKHNLISPLEPPKAHKFSLVGAAANGRPDKPHWVNDEEHDCMRRPEHDVNISLQQVIDDAANECAVM
jgi:hypothetical protein